MTVKIETNTPYQVTWYGVVWNHIFGISGPNLSIQYLSFKGATITIKVRVVYSGASPVSSDFWAKIFLVPSKLVPKRRLFGNWGSKYYFFLF